MWLLRPPRSCGCCACGACEHRCESCLAAAGPASSGRAVQPFYPHQMTLTCCVHVGIACYGHRSCKCEGSYRIRRRYSGGVTGPEVWVICTCDGSCWVGYRSCKCEGTSREGNRGSKSEGTSRLCT